MLGVLARLLTFKLIDSSSQKAFKWLDRAEESARGLVIALLIGKAGLFSLSVAILLFGSTLFVYLAGFTFLIMPFLWTALAYSGLAIIFFIIAWGVTLGRRSKNG